MKDAVRYTIDEDNDRLRAEAKRIWHERNPRKES